MSELAVNKLKPMAQSLVQWVKARKSVYRATATEQSPKPKVKSYYVTAKIKQVSEKYGDNLIRQNNPLKKGRSGYLAGT